MDTCYASLTTLHISRVCRPIINARYQEYTRQRRVRALEPAVAHIVKGAINLCQDRGPGIDQR